MTIFYYSSILLLYDVLMMMIDGAKMWGESGLDLGHILSPGTGPDVSKSMG